MEGRGKGGASGAGGAGWGPWRQEPWRHGGMGPWRAVERGKAERAERAGMHWGPFKVIRGPWGHGARSHKVGGWPWKHGMETLGAMPPGASMQAMGVEAPWRHGSMGGRSKQSGRSGGMHRGPLKSFDWV